jgi:hypothetical protein
MLTAASYVYEDLRLAEKMMRSQSSWLSSVYIKPAGLSPDISRGHRLTLDEEESFISYLDLSAGMIEAAQDRGEKCGRCECDKGSWCQVSQGHADVHIDGFGKTFLSVAAPLFAYYGPGLGLCVMIPLYCSLLQIATIFLIFFGVYKVQVI